MLKSDLRRQNVYSSFQPWQKNTIIGLAAFAGWFSSLSSFIYFPAIPMLAADLDVSITQINLTVTSYLIVSGIFPSIMGDAADRFGRRPVFLVGLTVYLGANIGLALQSNFGLLFFFRMVQSAGISGTYSITYGVLSDLFTPAERGGYSGVISFFLNTPPSLGPLLSGLLLIRWNWRSIFWFLSAATPCCLILMALILPETARNIVGDGSIEPKNILNRAPTGFLSANRTIPEKGSIVKPDNHMEPGTEAKRAIPNPLASLKLVHFPPTAIILICYGINYSVYTCLQASLSTLFLSTYHIESNSGIIAGVIYIPFGVACAIAAFTTGKLLDYNYQRIAYKSGIQVDNKRDEGLDEFPIERARLRGVKVLTGTCAALIMGYGWLLERHSHMAGPLILQFFIGLTIQSLFTALNTLLVDLHPQCPSTAQAACNFVRCEMAAGCLAALDVLLRILGPGWCFVLFGGLLAMVVPMLIVVEKMGMGWRKKRARGQRTGDSVC